MITKEMLVQYKPEIKEVPVKELNETAYIKVMTGPGREAFETACYDQESNRSNVRSAIVWQSLCDKSGNRIFNDKELSLVDQLPFTILQEIAEEALKLNRIGGDTAIEDAAKNSTATPDAS